MTPIVEAASEGYSGEDILKFMGKYFPKIAPRISQARNFGYTTDQILKYVNTLQEEGFGEFETPNEIEAKHHEKLNQRAKKILGTAATAAGTAAFVSKLPGLVGDLVNKTGFGKPKAGPNIPGGESRPSRTLSPVQEHLQNYQSEQPEVQNAQPNEPTVPVSNTMQQTALTTPTNVQTQQPTRQPQVNNESEIIKNLHFFR